MNNSTPNKHETATASLTGSIARSRSRYRGGRPIKPSLTAEESPSLGSSYTEHFQKRAPAVRRRQPSISDTVGLREPAVRRTCEPLKNTERLEPLDLGATHRQKFRDEFHPRNSPRGDKSVDIARPRNGVEDLGSGQTLVGQLGHVRQNQQDELRPAHVEEQPTSKRPSASNKKSLTQRIARQVDGDKILRDREELKRTISGPIVVESHQSTITPAFDAPISAVNAGERKVAVKCNDSTMWLSVTPSTTTLDILSLANEQSTGSIDVNTMMVVESYRQLGLERPLRKYEHIRDVLNSWDNDSQNMLSIVQSPTRGKDEDLELDSVAKLQPEGTSVSIYHSQRPGHWSKRWVTLRTDGQILIAKKDGGDTSNICHMSDFDIYIPTARQLSKKIRPPRKICFTIKSQQKSSMFMSTVNFVHFFSTSDKTLAASWYKAVQEWRSWYLVHVMGEGQKSLLSPKKVNAVSGDRAFNDTELMQNPRGRQTTRNDDQMVSARDDLSKCMPLRNRVAPPVSFPRSLTVDTEKGTSTPNRHNSGVVQSSVHNNDPGPDPFAATSLLGRTYTQRQKAQQSRELKQTLSGPPPQALPLTTDPSDGLKRASSRRQMTKPLIDLTPQYREPPQHSRKGRGVIPDQMPAGGLVEIATSPEAAVEVPPATTWQRPTTSGGGKDHGSEQHEMQRSRTVRRDHHRRSPSVSVGPRRNSSKSPEKRDGVPFTSGLLAGNPRSGQGATRTGRGILTGDRQARAPMLDVSEQSKYAYGSLLDQVEKKYDGVMARHPVVEREKRTEISAPVGEAV